MTLGPAAAIGIAAIAEYLPARRLGNAELVERFGFELSFLEQKLGIRERPIAGEHESISDMAVAAGEALFKSEEFDRTDVGLLIVCTQNPDFRLPATANLVQHRLGLATEVAAFDINQGCSGFVYGLAVAQGLMHQQNIETALLITSDAYTKVMDPSDRSTVPLFGDGAAATLVRRGGAGRIGFFSFGSDGSGAEDLIVRGGGSRSPSLPATGDGSLRMNGRSIYGFMMHRVPASVQDCLLRNNLSRDDIDLFIFHQASRYMIESLSTRMSIPLDRVAIVLEDTGNTVSSSIPLAMRRCGSVQQMSGKRVLISGFGVGLSWASTVIDFR